MNKILLVDDDPELRANMKEILVDAGYSTEEAASGEEALEKAVSAHYNMILLDLMMPGMDGIDTLVALRKISPKAKVIMITAFATVENAVNAIKKGASDYVTKPFRIDELLAIIGRVLEELRFDEDIIKLNMDFTLNSLSNPIRRNIIHLLLKRTNMRLMEITRELKIDDHTKVVFHLKMLREAGVISQDKNKSYSITKEGHKTVDCLKILEEHLSE